MLLGPTGLIRGVVYAVVRRDIRNLKRIDALQTANIEAVLVRAGSPLVVSVYAAVGTEIVLRGMGVELIKP